MTLSVIPTDVALEEDPSAMGIAVDELAVETFPGELEGLDLDFVLDFDPEEETTLLEEKDPEEILEGPDPDEELTIMDDVRFMISTLCAEEILSEERELSLSVSLRTKRIPALVKFLTEDPDNKYIQKLVGQKIRDSELSLTPADVIAANINYLRKTKVLLDTLPLVRLGFMREQSAAELRAYLSEQNEINMQVCGGSELIFNQASLVTAFVNANSPEIVEETDEEDSGTEEATLSMSSILGPLAEEDELVRRNSRLVVSVASKTLKNYLSLKERVLAGCDGLLRTVDCFCPERGNKFSTYATWWIKQKIREEVQRNLRTIRVPQSVIETISAMRKAEAEALANGEKVERNVGWYHDRVSGQSKNQIELALHARSQLVISADHVGPGQDESMGYDRFREVAVTVGPLDEVKRGEIVNYVQSVARTVLTGDELRVLELTGFLTSTDGSVVAHKRADVAKIMGLKSGEKVKQIGLLAQRKLQHHLGEKGLSMSA